MVDEKIEFKRLEREDLELMSTWLSSPEIKKWYPVADSSYPGVVKKYVPAIDGKEPIFGYVIRYQDQPIGYIQTYWCKDFPNSALRIAPPAGAAGLDIFIGNLEARGKGLGRKVLKLFLHTVVFQGMKATHCLVDPDTLNERAIKAYKSVGFYNYQDKATDEDEYLFLIIGSSLAVTNAAN